jgi:hypothetical protein
MRHPDTVIQHIKKSDKYAIRKHLLLSTRKALLLSLIMLGSGIVLSLHLFDWSWFSRSGCLVVVIGIFLTSSQIIENSRRLKSRRSYNDQNFHRDFADKHKQRALQRSRGLEEDIWENGLRGFYLLIVGTLVWGFGDLAGLLLS